MPHPLAEGGCMLEAGSFEQHPARLVIFQHIGDDLMQA